VQRLGEEKKRGRNSFSLTARPAGANLIAHAAQRTSGTWRIRLPRPQPGGGAAAALSERKIERAASDLGLKYTLRPRGRPKAEIDK
jgi:hypothetical protein